MSSTRQKLLFLALVISAAVHAGSRLGLQGGLSSANVNTDTGAVTSSRSGIAAGIHIESPALPFVFLQPELNYTQKGYSQAILGAVNTYQFDYLEVPILIKLKFGLLISFEVFAGPSLGICINHGYSVAGAAPQSVDIKTIDFAAHVGGGVNIDLLDAIGVFANARYISGLANISQTTATVQNKGFLLLAGLRVGI